MSFPKPGIIRLKGKALLALKHECHERDEYTCQECRAMVHCFCGEDHSVCHATRNGIRMHCYAETSGFRAEMAHIHTKRNNGDTLENVRTLCPECHRKEHSGELHGKPVPRKDLP